jgi:hypothetical protein
MIPMGQQQQPVEGQQPGNKKGSHQYHEQIIKREKQKE